LTLLLTPLKAQRAAMVRNREQRNIGLYKPISQHTERLETGIGGLWL
jgi:hypothetical protein